MRLCRANSSKTAKSQFEMWWMLAPSSLTRLRAAVAAQDTIERQNVRCRLLPEDNKWVYFTCAALTACFYRPISLLAFFFSSSSIALIDSFHLRAVPKQFMTATNNTLFTATQTSCHRSSVYCFDIIHTIWINKF